MEKRTTGNSGRPGSQGSRSNEPQQKATKRPRKMTEYGRQLQEKQKVKWAYGMREKQFERFFDMAVRSQKATGEELLCLLERRLDNVVYRLKLAATRTQARQIIVHGHIYVNGKKVHSPSYLVVLNDAVTVAPRALEKAALVSQIFDKSLKSSGKVPEWLESDKKGRAGKVLRLPVRSDILMEVSENSIVEFYSK